MDNQEATPTSEGSSRPMDAPSMGQPAAGAPPTPPAPPTSESGGGTSEGDGSHKGLAILGYIFPVLFFLPLLMEEAKSHPFARFHANQQLILLIWYVIANVIVIIPLLGWIVSPLMMVFGIVVAVVGVINSVQGKKKPLPLIGGFELLK